MNEKRFFAGDGASGGNREYKSDVFSMLMEYPENALAVYNAINHSDYKDSGLVEMCRLDRGISLSVRNDASFIVDTDLSIYEHESTVCPNMPVRLLLYIAPIISGLVKGKDIYGRRLVRIPTPRFVVFYNGEEQQSEQYEMRLSDAFERRVEQPELELVCTVYNINRGKNAELLDRCGTLREYMIFVDYVRENVRTDCCADLEQCIEAAIERCIQENVLRDFLMERRAEVLKVMTLDYTFERRLELQRAEVREEALAEGITQGISQGISQGLIQGRVEDIIELLSDVAPVPDDMKGRLLSVTDMKVLSQLHKRAARVQSIEEFETYLEQMNL